MPQFILDSAGNAGGLQFGCLDAFTGGYIEALFFTENAPGVDTEQFLSSEYQADMEQGHADGTVPDDTGFSDLAPASLAVIIADCAEFQREGAALLEAAYKSGDYTAERAGNDFWFSRNGHGVGFDDRDLGGDIGADLCALASAMGEVYVFFGNAHVNPDSLVHVDGEQFAPPLPAPTAELLENVGSCYGAPMGRRGSVDVDGSPARVERIGLSSQGYDSGGAYWGLGEPLWRAVWNDGAERFFRATDSKAAWRIVNEESGK